jgi:hypothetical protein
MNDTPQNWSKRWNDPEPDNLLNRSKINERNLEPKERKSGLQQSLIIATVIVVGWMMFGPSSKPPADRQAEFQKTMRELDAKAAARTAKEADERHALKVRTNTLDLDKLQISKASWSKSGFGTVMMYDFSVTNSADAPMKDLRLECTTYGASGTKLNTLEYTLYEKIPEGKTRTFRDLNIGFIDGQSTGAECSITSAVKGY